MNNIIIAITGPSGVGKTTLGNLLISRNNFVTPHHSTTRGHRTDDQEGFYRYLTHQEFKEQANQGNFLFWSGDSEIISPIYGNYYGILRQDYDEVSQNEGIVMFVSYKDFFNIYSLKEKGYNIEIVNLVYNDIEKNMPIRLSEPARNQTQDDIARRIKCAVDYEKKFGDLIRMYDILKVQSDVLNVEETYDVVVKKLIRKG